MQYKHGEKIKIIWKLINLFHKLQSALPVKVSMRIHKMVPCIV